MKVQDVKTAVDIANNYFQTLKPDIGGNIQDIRLEEVEISEDEKMWFITLGYHDVSNTKENPLLATPIDDWKNEKRIYKRIAIDAETGKVKSMKIRKV